MLTKQMFILLAIAFCCVTTVSVHSQSLKEIDLYSQTSEMNNIMINYDADLGSISRFYTTSGTAIDWNFGRQGSNYNSPERRARLLQLNNDYLKHLDLMDFDRMSINGKVDFILFKRNLDDLNYQLLEEQNNYAQVIKFFPFSDRIYELEKPRLRGAAVDAEKIAKELNSIQKDIEKAIVTIKKEEAIEMKLANLASAAAKGLQGSLKNTFDFYNGYDPLFTWWVPKTNGQVDSLLN